MISLVFLLRGAFRPVRYEFPDPSVVVVGRARAGESFGVERRGDHYRVRVPAESVSDEHATLVLRDGVVTVEDRGSRNGVFRRLAPGVAHALSTEAVWLGPELSLRLDAARWDIPQDFEPLTPETLCAVVAARVGPAGVAATLGEGAESAWRIEGDARHLTLRPTVADRTLAADDTAWVQLVVNAYNTAVDARRRVAPWRFTAASLARSRALEQCRRAAPTSLPVLLLGPSGSGKELLAQGLHDHGAPRGAPFVAVNCAELSAERLEAQLFGHARGAFTGAHADRAGLVEAAAGGTLFLDEVAELSPDVQAKLLRYLESERGEYRRVGDAAPRFARVRVLAATHRDLSLSTAAPGFRRDLYFRLAGVVVHVPAPEADDVRAITRELFATRGKGDGPVAAELDAVAADAAARPWPGGARALRQCVDRCLQMHDPARSWLDNWRDACGAPPRASEVPRLTLDVQPAAVGRSLSDLLFLATARDARSRAELARRLSMTYQAVDQRLQSMGLALDDRDAIARRLDESIVSMRAATATNPALAALFREVLGA